jgi:hypothetical protein
MAVLVAMTLIVAGAASAATTVVVLHLHMLGHYHVQSQDPTRKFLQQRHYTWSHPEQF